MRRSSNATTLPPGRAASWHLPAWIAAALVFLSAGYFQNTRPGWNVNSQLALTLAIVDEGSLRIDAYHARPETQTNDKAFFEGHFYSDKSPVTALLGVPAYAAYRWAFRTFGFQYSYDIARYFTTWWSVGVCAGALAWLLTGLLARHGVPPRRAAILASLWIASTPLMGYSILFFNYLPACVFATGGYFLLEPILLSSPGDEDLPAGYRNPRLLLAGTLLGLASWTLPTLALLALILTLALLWTQPAREWARRWPWAAGGILGMAGYAIYSLSIFGEITNPYRYEYDPNFAENMRRGLMGAEWPQWRVLHLITLHPFRGLFILFPSTLAAALGCALGLRKPELRLPCIIALAYLAGLLLYNSGYYMWWGGWAYAPRHLIPALPLLALGLIPWLAGSAIVPSAKVTENQPEAKTNAPRKIRWALAVLLCILAASAVANIMVISLDPQPPPGISEDLLKHPEMVEDWPLPYFTMLRHVASGQTDLNWGRALGLRGIASLLPLVGIWILGLVLLARLHPSRDREEATSMPGSGNIRDAALD